MGRADLIQLLSAKKVARKWITKVRLGRLEKQAKAIQEEYSDNQDMKAKKINSLKRHAHNRLEKRKERRASVGSTATKMSEKSEKTDTSDTSNNKSSPKGKRNKSASKNRRASTSDVSTIDVHGFTPKPMKLQTASEHQLQILGKGKHLVSMASLGTPEFQTNTSSGNLLKTPLSSSKTSSPPPERVSTAAAVSPSLKYFEIKKGMKLNKLGFRLRAPNKKSNGHAWVSNVDLSGPSFSAGVRDNDQIYTIGNKTIENMKIKEIVMELKNQKKPYKIGFLQKQRRSTTKQFLESHFHVSELKAKEDKKRLSKLEEDKNFT